VMDDAWADIPAPEIKSTATNPKNLVIKLFVTTFLLHP